VKFEVRTRAHSLRDYTRSAEDIIVAAQALLKTEIQAVAPGPLRLRLMGRLDSLHVAGTGVFMCVCVLKLDKK